MVEAGIKALADKRETVFSETVPLKLCWEDMGSRRLRWAP